jgi:membrane protease YdiL (CAAX protease family)
MAVTWGFWESVLLALVGFIVGALLAVPFAATSTNGDLTDTAFALAAIFGEIGILGTVWAWLLIRHRRSAKALAVNPRKPADALIGFGLGLVLYFVAVVGIAQIIALLLDRIAGHAIESPDQLPTSLSGAALALTGFAVIVCAPIAEELLFRGMLFRSLRDKHGFWAGAVASSLLFGAVHWQGSPWEASALLASTLAFVGLALAALYEWRKNLLVNIFAHCAFNVVGFVLFVTGTVHLR